MMEKWLYKIYSNWMYYVKWFLFFVGVFLLILHTLFKWQSGIKWIEADWSSGDIMSFVGSILSFIGTVILGCITAKLSIDNNNINARLVEIENKRDLLEKDKRLGYIVPEKIAIKYYYNIKEEISDGHIAYGIGESNVCNINTVTIHFILSMKVVAESIINSLDVVSVRICEMNFKDNLEDMSSQLCWMSFYERQEVFARGVNHIDNTFEEPILLSESDRNPDGFYELRKLMIGNIQYMIQLKFEYTNTLQEKRKEILEIICLGNRIIRYKIRIAD